MAHDVQVAAGLRNVQLPDGNVYQGGALVTLTDAQFATLGSGLFPSTLIDLGLFDTRPEGIIFPDVLALAGNPPGLYRPNMRRTEASYDLAALTTQVMTSVALYLQAGDTVTNLTFKSGATAAATPTNWWFALHDTSATPALLGQSADQLTAAWAANTGKTLAMATPVPIPKSGVYYASIMVKAGTVPSLVGDSVPVGVSAGVLPADKALTQTSGSALTGTAPATITSAAVVGAVPLVIAT